MSLIIENTINVQLTTKGNNGRNKVIAIGYFTAENEKYRCFKLVIKRKIIDDRMEKTRNSSINDTVNKLAGVKI